MSVDFNGVSGKNIRNPGDNSQVAATDASKQQPAAPDKPSAAGDQVSLTHSATQLKALEKQVSELPVVDVKRVTSVQRSVNIGSFSFEPVKAADNLVTQERELAMLEISK